jgi:DNA repair protein RecO (recombination protein O)
MSERERVLLELGFVLHQRPYRNTSQLLECLTAEHGRVGLIARGSRRTNSRQRALLQPFAPLRLSWLQRGELGQLTHVEPAAAAGYGLEGQCLLAGYYGNELLLRLTARGDPNQQVFSCYSRCLAELGERARVARTLRIFELHLLKALGYGVELDVDAATGEPLRPERRYVYEVEHGARATELDDAHADAYPGSELISLREQTLTDEGSLRTAQRLLGRILRVYLGERPLQSRQVLQDIVSRGLSE